MRLLVFLLLLQTVCSQTEFPNPQREWRMCGMSKPAFVCDPEYILTRGDAEKLDQIAAEFRKSTSCLCPKCPDNIGVSLGIFIRHNVSKEIMTKYPNGKAISEMIRRRWGLSSCDGDIVILLLTQQNISEFSFGPAVTNIFPQETASKILHDCLPHFETGWYYQGLESIANSFNDVLVKLQRQTVPTFKNLIFGIAMGFGVLLILAITAFIIMHRQSQKRKKSYCSDIFEGVPTKNNRRKPSFNQEEHFEKLRHLNTTDEEEDQETSYGQYTFTPSCNSLSTNQFIRMQRQLSDVAEESAEDIEIQKYASTSLSSSQKGNIPVTEL
ncbi:uncharacterized protein NPIL_52571 [Nephila pilipes]|uniref:TPM domain-containing protein n=1 Tax=Nephila pilipes TaxID=299642 RepID=A0A8X6N473_NEPPI|nr:uncharacterized protein NPIL_52571 [Nephila pilipes]